MFRKILLVFVTLALAACGGAREYLPDMKLALGLTQAGASFGIQAALDGGSMTKCVGWTALRETAGNASTYLSDVIAHDRWDAGLPAINVSYDDCRPLMKDGAWRPVLPDVATPIVNGFVLPVIEPLGARVTKWIESSDMPCRTKVVLVGVVAYVRGIIPPLLAELAAPDGVFEAPGVVFGFGACEA